MNQDIPFSETDALSLRKWARSLGREGFSADNIAAIQMAPPEFRRYLDHYGFTQLFQVDTAFTYSLNCHQWNDYEIMQHHWSQANSRGTVIVVHGLFDHMGLYLKLVQRLLQEGYNVAGFDLPGHGLSSGGRVTISDFGRYSAVLNHSIAFCESNLPGPYFAVGQSTGCSAIMHWLIDANTAAQSSRQSAALSKVVLLAPLVRVRSWASVVLAHTLLHRFIKRLPRHFGANSHDGDFLEFLDRADPLQARFVDVPWVTAMRAWVKKFIRASSMHNRLLVIQGTEDKTVDWRWNIPLIQQKFPKAMVHYVNAGFHHLVNEAEPWRGEVFDTLCDFLEE